MSIKYVAKPAPEISLQDQLREAEQRVTEHLALIKKRQSEFCTPQELSTLQRQHSENLRIWSGLKIAVDKERNTK